LFWDWQRGSGAFQPVAAKPRTGIPRGQPGRAECRRAAGQTVRIFDADTFKRIAETPDAPDWVNDAASFSADGRWLATTGNDGRVGSGRLEA
jgi:hypothetical protein